MGNIVKGYDRFRGDGQSIQNEYTVCDDRSITDIEANAMTECEAQGFSWLKGSEQKPRMRLAILKAEIPAFFHEGYPVDPDETEDLLYKAIEKGREADVKVLLRDQTLDINARLQCVPYTPLHIACETGNLAIVKTIKEKGANVNLLSDGYSPLVTASRHGHTAVITYLLNNGAFIDQQAEKEIVNSFVKEEFSQDLVRQNVVWRTEQEVRCVVAELCDPYWGNTALMQACREHHKGIVTELISKGCKTDIQNSAGNTALHHATLSRTANIHTTDSSMYVPATLIIGGNRDIVRVLLDAGADPDIRNAAGETPLDRCFRLMVEKDPLSMHGWGFSTENQLEVLRRLMHVIRELLIGGCDVRGNLSHETNDLDSIFWTVSNIVKICSFLDKLDKTSSLHCLYQDMLLLFYECVFISEKFFTWDDFETVILGEDDMDETFRGKLLDINRRIFSLSKWCRIVIRQSISGQIRKKVSTLPVPNDIKRFILFSDLDY